MNTGFRLVVICFFSVCLSLRADELTTRVQQFLKQEGYYTGTVDGQTGQETAAALKRYQIHSGLPVTSVADDATLHSMNLGVAEHSIQKPAAPPLVERESVPANRAPTPGGPGQTGWAVYSEFFARTPYQTAPEEVQSATCSRAMLVLQKRGYYHGLVDGYPNQELQKALVRYQYESRMPVTGRLDLATLDRLHLLPGVITPHRHRVVEEPQPAQPVYRGIWIR